MTEGNGGPDYLQALRLDGRGMVILGAGGGGIGTESAKALRQAGAELLLVDIDQRRADEVARATGGESMVADILVEEEMKRVFARAEAKFGDHLYGLVDIVGMVKPGGMVDPNAAAVQDQLDFILKHAIWAARVAGPLLAARGKGSMVFVGSLAGASAVGRNPYYGIAKAGLHQLVRFAALEFGPSGVRTNAVAPSVTLTPRVSKGLSPETLQSLEATNPLRRAAEPAEIARAILFLSSDMASYVNGDILMLDGGASLGRGG
ncbi:MAG: SDR family oxidoreductase [Caulobacteraceae bacterium]|nr:SDR family oxidoreductase [Caulobacteraceae bacterium]